MKDLSKFTVEYPGRPAIVINPFLIKKQKVSKKGLETLKELHYESEGILKNMEDTDDPATLKELNHKWVQVQFKLQRTWGFPENDLFHPWFTVPKCSCPKMDNAERLGTKYHIITSNCPIHGLESK